jgi:hypothetical protein
MPACTASTCTTQVIVAFAHCVHDPATAYGHHDVYLHPATDGGGVGVPVEVYPSLTRYATPLHTPHTTHHTTHTTHHTPRTPHKAHMNLLLAPPLPALSPSFSAPRVTYCVCTRTIGSRFGGRGG